MRIMNVKILNSKIQIFKLTRLRYTHVNSTLQIVIYLTFACLPAAMPSFTPETMGVFKLTFILSCVLLFIGVPVTPTIFWATYGDCGGKLAIFGLNALGFLSSIMAIVSLRIDSFSILLQQPLQLQFLQYSPLAKHSQYNFKHFEFLQLQFFFPVFYYWEDIPGVVKVGGK